MSIFETIKNAILGHPGISIPSAGQAPQAPGITASGSGPVTPAAPAPTQPAPAPAAPVDVDAVLAGLAAQKGQPSNYKTSIVDLMKLLDLDSSLHNREELARELGYTGALDGSADMNIWLHREVMQKLAQNGGRVSAELQG